MCALAKNRIEACIIGIITLVMMPMVLAAQPTSSALENPPPVSQRTYTAPPPKAKQETVRTIAINEAPRPLPQQISDIEPRIEILKVSAGNPDHLSAGFYASFEPKTYDTVFIYEGETDKYEVIGIHANKEVIQGDSGSVAEEVTFRMNHFNENDIPVANEQHTKTNSMIIRTGFIPSQGFGSKRYRFAIKPGKFILSGNSMISASVHMTHGENIGTILCAVTNIDFKKGIFYVETSNEVPKGEDINWIIINSM